MTATDALLSLFAREGYRRVEPPILQPADIFVELSGEDIRRRMFSTQDASGAELCLRPEYTIPVCREHVARRAGTAGAAYAYAGPVFRLRFDAASEFVQAGVESFGRTDRDAADADVLALALEGLEALGVPAPSLSTRLGDMGLLGALIDALGVTAAQKRRILRAIASGRGFRTALGPGGGASAMDTAHPGLLAAIEGQAPQAARAFVEDVLSIAGISTVGGRSAAEIADRFLASAAAARSGPLAGEAGDVIAAYLALRGDPRGVSEPIRALDRSAGLALGPALDAFDRRTDALVARGLPVDRFAFAPDFARNLDYYTGLIFEISAGSGALDRPLVGGGRYDRLLGLLGAPTDIPAVGCAFWLERLAPPSNGVGRG